MGLIDHTKEDPVNIDFDNAFVVIFDENDEYTSDDGHLVVFDDSEFFDSYERREVLELVKRKKMDGIAINGEMAKKIIIGLLEAYGYLMVPEMTIQDRLKAANNIRDVLESMRLI